MLVSFNFFSSTAGGNVQGGVGHCPGGGNVLHPNSGQCLTNTTMSWRHCGVPVMLVLPAKLSMSTYLLT